jgi:hypothetical protein
VSDPADGEPGAEHHRPGDRGSPRQAISNWREYQATFGTKLGLAARNLSVRLRGRSCCGHAGQPGC